MSEYTPLSHQLPPSEDELARDLEASLCAPTTGTRFLTSNGASFTYQFTGTNGYGQSTTVFRDEAGRARYRYGARPWLKMKRLPL